MALDDGDTQRKPVSNRAPPLEAFQRALGSTMFACEHLGAAIRVHDVDDVHRAATDAVESWLTMCGALRKLEITSDQDVRLRVQTARSATRAYRRVLAELLDRAQAQLAVPSLHEALQQLRISVALANGEHAFDDADERR